MSAPPLLRAGQVLNKCRYSVKPSLLIDNAELIREAVQSVAGNEQCGVHPVSQSCSFRVMI